MPPSTQPLSSNIVLPPITAFDQLPREAPAYNLDRASQHHYLPYPPQVPQTSSVEPRASFQPGPTSFQAARQLWPSQRYALPQQARAPPQDHNLLVAQQPQERSNFKEVKRRTKTGCQTCRKRRIKCDEARPTCRNCLKSKRACQGYDPSQQTGGPSHHNSSHLHPIPRSHPNDQHSLSPSTSQSESYTFGRAASISSHTSSITTEPDYGHHSESILPPLLPHSPSGMNDLSFAQQEYPHRTLPPPDQPVRRAKRCTIDELCTIEGTQRPNLPPLPNTPPNLDAIKTIFDTAFASGLDKLLETTWYTKYAFQYLVNDLAFLAQILAYITMIHNRDLDGEEVKLRSQEARIIWALLGLCVRPQPRTDHLRCLTGRLHAISVMLTGEGVPSSGDVVFEDSGGVDNVEANAPQPTTVLEKQERERQHEFWRAVGKVVSNSWNHSVRAQKNPEEVEAMNAAAKQALDECRARLDNRENRDLVYSVLVMRHLSERWASEDELNMTMDGAAESPPADRIPSDVTMQWNVSRRFIEQEASGRSTTLVLSVLAGMAGRAWA